MADIEKVIKGLEEAKTMLAQAVDRGGEMAVMGAFKCLNRVTDAIALIDTQYKLILELQNLISIGTKMMNGDEA